MSTNCRQHYQLATGEPLTKAPAKTANPGFKKGGRVSFKKGAQNAAASAGHSPYPMGKKC